MKRNKMVWMGLLVISLLLFSTVISLAADKPVATPVVAEVVITIQNFSFNPSEVTVAPGTKVTWINKDSVRHNVVFKDSSGPLLAKGEQWSMVFNETGTYSYNCGPHHFMKGTVIVK